ncbi:unnamed protein product [Acanthocheilonema viteae]|uniref:C2H2-type domain-containing protein n=1 Tax=Acanthocheilonema viteae TaxID=6277 RepID=A0A498SXW3_ACAVI|nr:unnamed protein product [Acanthocheilonema viteae]
MDIQTKQTELLDLSMPKVNEKGTEPENSLIRDRKISLNSRIQRAYVGKNHSVTTDSDESSRHNENSSDLSYSKGHKRTHSGKESGSSSESSSDLSHLRGHGGKPYSCLECERRFALPYLLKAHVMMDHSSEKP